MTNPLILSIDCGTQSIRALIFDLHGRLILKARLPLEYRSEQPGWGEQDAEYFWKALYEVCRGLWREQPELRLRIAGVTLTTQRATVINLGESGRPLRPAILWFDKRRCLDFNPVGGLWGLGFRLIGMKESIDYFQSMAESTWLAHHQPGVMEQTHRYLLLSGYLLYRLTGQFRDSIASQVGYIPFDYRRHEWASSRDWKWQALHLRRDQLPELILPGCPLGTITRSAAEATGLPEGLPVISGGADKACEMPGCGVQDEETGHLSFGTTATINVLSAKYVEPVRFLPPYPAAFPGQYTLEVQIFRGFWMVSWFKKQFGYEDEVAALKEGRSAEEILEEHIKDIPPGCNGLVVQPYWSPGLKVPGPEARGAVIGFTDWHTRYHVYRAILEGLLFALREGAERIERTRGIRLKRLVASGGGSQSDLVMQMTADIFGLPVERPENYEASGLGAAMLAASGLGFFPGVSLAVERMKGPVKVFQPDRKNQETYDRLYREVYRNLYGQLEGIYREMRYL